MGRTSYSYKQLSDELKKIEISWLYKNGYLPLGKLGGFTRGGIKWTDKWSLKEESIGFYISISEEKMYFQPVYSLTDEYGVKENLDYKIPLTTSRCSYGGRRYWFLCPLIRNNKLCGRRVGTLYLVRKYFGCRHCQYVTSRSHNENRRHKWQSVTRRWRLEEKLEELEMAMFTKRTFYNAKLTKHQRKLSRLNLILYGEDRQLY